MAIETIVPAPTRVSEDARKKILACLQKVPPFSAVLRRVLATLAMGDDEISLPDIAKLIEKDTIMSGKLLSVANSALYGRGHEISSIRHAVAILGTTRVRNIILALSVNRFWDGIRVPDEFSVLRFNQHSLATATLSDMLVERIPSDDPENAFIAGLFHDVGQLVMLNMSPAEYNRVLHDIPFDGPELQAREHELFGFTHADVSAEVTSFWRLPASLQAAVRFHERPLSSEKQSSLALSEIVHAADRYVAASGFSVLESQQGEEESRGMLQKLGVNEEEVFARFLEQFSVLCAVA